MVEKTQTFPYKNKTLLQRVVFIVFFCIAVADFLPHSANAQTWCDTAWSNRKIITISSTNVDANLSNFPLLVSVTDTDLRDNANTDGLDIFFTEEANCTKLDWEKESYNSSTGALLAWVNVTTISSSSNTVLYMYYGNASAADQTDAENVWDTNFQGVWHLGESSGTRLDATSKSNDLTDNNTVTSATGQIGTAADFNNAVPEYLSRTNANLSASFPGKVSSSAMTASAWVSFDSEASSHTHNIIVKDAGLFFLWKQNSDDTLNGFISSDTVVSATSLSSNGVWYYVTHVYNGSNMQLYVNGSADGAAVSHTTFPTGAVSFKLGTRDDLATNRSLDGRLDEARISNIARSAEWIKFEYHNQFGTAGTLTFASQETVPASGRNFSPSIGSIQANSITATSAVVSWSTSVATLTTLIGQPSPETSSEPTTNHYVTFTNLKPNTIYSYIIQAQRPGSSSVGTATFSFKTFAASASPVSSFILGDLNKDGKVNIFDVSILLSLWGKIDAPSLQTADITAGSNNDSLGRIDIFDVNELMTNWTG